MSVDLIKALSLFIAFLLYGNPNQTETTVSFGLQITNLGTSIELNIDPTYIYYRNLTIQNACGITIINTIIIDPSCQQLEKILEHEMGHIWQYRNYGLGFVVTYPLFTEYYEGGKYTGAISIPPHKTVLNFPLIKISLPIIEFK